MRLALECGEPNVDEFARSITTSNLHRWEKYYQHHPSVLELLDIHLSHVASCIVNIMRGFSKQSAIDSNRFRLLDQGKPKQTPEQMWKIWCSAAKRLKRGKSSS